LAAVAGFAAVALAAAGLGCAEHTPIIVITGAPGGTAAEASSGAWAGWDGAGAPGTACPHASVTNKAHINHLLRITHFLQDWSLRK
jgi:hypothetical protein